MSTPITKYDVAVGDEACHATVKQVVLSVKEESYTVEINCSHCRTEGEVEYRLNDASREAKHRLLDSLRKYVHIDTNFMSHQGMRRAVATIHLPYVHDEVVAGIGRTLRHAKADTSQVKGMLAAIASSNRKLTAEVNALKALWFVRLYLTVKSWLA